MSGNINNYYMPPPPDPARATDAMAAFLALTFPRFIIKKKHLEAVSRVGTRDGEFCAVPHEVWGVRDPPCNLRGSYQGSLCP